MTAKKQAAAAEPLADVHTSAQTDPAPEPAAEQTAGCGGCGNCADCEKPAFLKPSAPHPRDDYSGQGGTYVRDPLTGARKPVTE